MGTMTPAQRRALYESARFARETTYNGPLGPEYTPAGTRLRLWAPTAEQAAVNLYRKGHDSPCIGTLPLQRGPQGVWSIWLPGDQHGHYYTFTVTVDGVARETGDPYARAGGLNGLRSMIVDLARTAPAGWERDVRPVIPPARRSVWEVNVRDFSQDAASGVRPAWRGKFLAFTQTGTTLHGDGIHPTCLNYLKRLGVGYVQLMPIFDFGSVDEAKTLLRQYNWGYDPTNYNFPEGSYSTDPARGEVRVRECKEMIAALHAAGIGVIMDVVYNHTSPDSILATGHPEFFLRDEAGNPTRKVADWSDVVDLDYSNRELWKYQIETLKIWAEIVDGFRCDVASAVPLAFWREAREQVERVRPGCIWLAESVHAAHTMAMRRAGYYCAADTELYDAFDITYDYDIWPYFEGCFQPTGTLREYTALVNFQESEYPAGYVKLRCLENHDQPRFASRVDSDEALRNWLALLYFEKGTTLLYSGQEYAPRHRVDLFNADDAYCDMRLDLQPYLKQLRQMKRTLPMSACFQLEAVEERAVVGRYDGPEARVRGIFDLKNAGGSVAVDLPDGTYTDRITGQEVTVSGGAFDLAQAPAVIG